MTGVSIGIAEAKAMSREDALRTLAAHGDERDRHMAQLMLAGPSLSLADELRLRDWFPLPRPVTVAVRISLRSMAHG